METSLYNLFCNVADSVSWQIVLSLFLLFACLFLFSYYPPRSASGRHLGVRDLPGPLSLPWLGTRWITASMVGRYRLSQLHNAYQDMRRRYGPIMREEALGNIPVVSLFHGADIEKVARFPSRCPIRPPTEISVVYRASRPDRYTNSGIVNEQGEKWEALRLPLTKDIIRPTVISRFLPDLDGVAQDFAALLRSSRGSENCVQNLEFIVKHLGLESMSTLVLGRRVGVLDREYSSSDRELGMRLARVVEQHTCACRDSYFGLLPFWKYIPTKIYSQYKEAEEEFYDIVSKLVDEALQDKLDTSSCQPVQEVFISILSASNLEQEDKKSAIIDFIISGIMTTGNTLLFLLYYVAKHPKVQNRIYEELMSLAMSGNQLNVRDLRRAPYLHAVVQETYRIHPTAIQVARILETDMEFSGYHLPSGTVVLCHNWIACMDEENFTRASEFRPERWLSDKSCEGWKFSPKFVAPFGYGTRKCPGETFTDQMLHLLLARMVENFRMEYNGQLKTKFEFLLAPEGPINLILHDR